MRGRRAVAIALAFAATLLLVGLGVWQVERLRWKRALIAQVERRLAAPPVAAPGPAGWAAIDRDDAYTRVQVQGRWRPGTDTFVQAVTELGGGYWVLTPLDTDAGWRLLVNRGFVPTGSRDALTPPTRGPVTVTGLLRVTEPGGAFLRHNDPAADRWYSRDVAAIAAARGIGGTPNEVAPYFVDADAAPNPGGLPVGGLTVVAFHNNHLVYALTWYALALMSAGALVYALRRPNPAR